MIDLSINHPLRETKPSRQAKLNQRLSGGQRLVLNYLEEKRNEKTVEKETQNNVYSRR